MVLFDWKRVYDASSGSISTCNIIMKMLITKDVPKNQFDPSYRFYNKKASLLGSSFLLHGELLLYHSYKYTKKELAEYYALASLRSLADYYASQKTTLDTVHCPVDLEDISHNRLLIVEEDEITFIYEEVNLETIH